MQTTTHSSARQVAYNYGTSGSFDDVLSRIALIRHSGGGHAIRDLASYLHNGTGRMVEVRYESASVSPEVHLSRFDSGTPEVYLNLDRFGRVQSRVWKNTTPTLLDQFDYDHDLAENRSMRDIPGGLVSTLDQLFTYDALDRLRTYDEGTISSGSIASPTEEADWTLDALGNWSSYEEKSSSTTTLDQDRTHNAANEITDITNTTDPPG